MSLQPTSILLRISESQGRIEQKLEQQDKRLASLEDKLTPIQQWFIFLKYLIITGSTLIALGAGIRRAFAYPYTPLHLFLNGHIMDSEMSLYVPMKCSYVVTSAYRDEEHNKEVGGSPSSYHLKNLARDIVLVDCSPDFVVDQLPPFISYIIYNSHLHLDLRPYPWLYKDERGV